MSDGTKDWCKIWGKTDLCFLKIFVYRLKNSDFILESKFENWKLKIARMFPILTSRNRLMNILLMVNIITIKEIV